MNILDQIIERKKLEVRDAKSKISLDQLVNNAISGDYEPDVANQLILL